LKKGYDVALRGHHLRILNRFSFLDEESRKKWVRQFMFRWGYGKQHTDYVINILKKIVKSDDIKIKIVSTLDDICKECKLKKSICRRDIDEYDLNTSTNIGLKIDKIYSSKYILKKLEKADRENKI
jgi:hypothetical protein